MEPRKENALTRKNDWPLILLLVWPVSSHCIHTFSTFFMYSQAWFTLEPFNSCRVNVVTLFLMDERKQNVCVHVISAHENASSHLVIMWRNWSGKIYFLLKDEQRKFRVYLHLQVWETWSAMKCEGCSLRAAAMLNRQP